MDIKIFNVEHGFCATIVLDDDHTILIDCGYNFSKGFSPGMYLVKSHHTKVDCLILPSYSSRHLEGLTDLLTQFVDNFFTPKILVTNPSLMADKSPDKTLEQLGIHNVLKLFCNTSNGSQTFEHSLRFEDLRLTFFWNNVNDTKNIDDLSLVTFVRYYDVTVLFPGDLTADGWKRLLAYEKFVELLEKTSIFVASNHGQKIGYCADVFKYCRPQLVIVSNDVDHPITETMIKTYANYAKGIPVDRQANRQLLMTHRDGRINLSRYLDRGLDVTTEPQYGNY